MLYFHSNFEYIQNQLLTYQKTSSFWGTLPPDPTPSDQICLWTPLRARPQSYITPILAILPNLEYLHNTLIN